jgi:hypothetical protein
MARSSIRLRQEAERARIEIYDATLRRDLQRSGRRPLNFEQAIREVRAGFEFAVLRDPYAWRPQLKTRDAGRLRLAAARHLFARYPVGEHLEHVWVDSSELAPEEIRLRKRWYIVAAGGGALYKEGAGEWLTRKEVHAFLNPMPNLSFEAAFWQAIARSYTGDPDIVMRIARSKMAGTRRPDLGFWREAVRFFCAHPTTVDEMDDLHDYLAHCHRQDPEFDFKGRTLAALRRLMQEWHHDLAAIRRIEEARRRAPGARRRPRAQSSVDDSRWAGAPISNWSWIAKGEPRARPEEYHIIQLRTAADLVAETRAMHHCVSSYAGKCIAGNASIWSLRRRRAGNDERLLTIELDPTRRVVQVRGFANRAATGEELMILRRWAKAHAILLAC